ncbi:MAG: cysteine-rich CWC family protein [Bacteroidia bacterium]
MKKNCSKCDKEFDCCNDKAGCWCEDLYIDIDTLRDLKKEFDNCLCSECLREYISADSN